MADLDAVHARLKSLLGRHREGLAVTADGPGGMKLEVPGLEGKPWGYAAGTRLGKRYVSLYLMGVYASPGIVAGLSPELRARMQGKSCFNFTTIDEGLFEEVSGVIRRSMSGFDEVAWRIDRERSKTPKGRAPAV